MGAPFILDAKAKWRPHSNSLHAIEVYIHVVIRNVASSRPDGSYFFGKKVSRVEWEDDDGFPMKMSQQSSQRVFLTVNGRSVDPYRGTAAISTPLTLDVRMGDKPVDLEQKVVSIDIAALHQEDLPEFEAVREQLLTLRRIHIDVDGVGTSTGSSRVDLSNGEISLSTKGTNSGEVSSLPHPDFHSRLQRVRTESARIADALQQGKHVSEC
ncbi:hypothetical protein CSUI_010271 [Cystoisospora suis]|uniref:Uncharacterized protein n=1 Tax=Cystoisospora suis TaxID=483139 RepID=A0A2C6KHP5_9APIC|nr:hypothetical protein CSUI_010271 [Cystoisospora suis]